MSKILVFQDSYLISGIMCFQGCGNIIQSFLDNCFNDCKKEKLIPENAQLIIDAEPSGLGIHRLILTIETENEHFEKQDNLQALLHAKFKESLESLDFKILDPENENLDESSNKTNWVNIAINLLAIATILCLYLIFPASIPLTISLAVISFLTTAFTARGYLVNFYHNLRNKNFANMSTTITLGWFLSLAHTIYHAIRMPLLINFSMVFMSFIMPVTLITFINGMDEIKRLVLNRSRKMNIEGMKSLFPQMAEEYRYYPLNIEGTIQLKQWLEDKQGNNTKTMAENLSELDFLKASTTNYEKKNLLQEGMVIEVKRGECFPVDCILLEEHTIIDASLITGERRQAKKLRDKIPAGAINFGQNVKVYALANSYNSEVNRLLFPANRARTPAAPESNSKFIYLYSALIIFGIVVAIICPLALGSFTLPLLMQLLMGILFAICPCTIAIAEQLPRLLSMFHRHNKGIQLRDESLTLDNNNIHTLVFDKTGTLTTGNSTVESSDLHSAALWERIYLLEKHQGAEHPLAKAICNYYEAKTSDRTILNQIENSKIDIHNRGLSALVQGRTIHIGNAAYLRDCGIELPDLNHSKLEQGLTPIYVAEDKLYQGVIFIKHELRPGIAAALTRLKNEGKKLIMLTGDSQSAAFGFNQQINKIFAESDIHSAQIPQDKENFLKQLMSTSELDPKGVWFVGDGLNDAPCARIVSEKGGISCAMNATDKAAFFTDLCLNGSLDYLFHHQTINQFLKKNLLQNKGILIFSTLAFLAFIISFSVAGIAVSPLIPLTLMLSTTLLVLFNSYRIQLSIDNSLDKITSWPKKILASDLSLALLIVACALLIGGILIATLATGGLALPFMAFTTGTIAALSSSCTLSAITLFGLFIVLVISHLVRANCKTQEPIMEIPTPPGELIKPDKPTLAAIIDEQTYSFKLGKPYKTIPKENFSEETLEPAFFPAGIS
ncbi:MAG: HAD-IC family P-type ATPase [Tatlockia sp.]|nr:HAD-IC family P-type ATPase [Tatlockia sp.]